MGYESEKRVHLLIRTAPATTVASAPISRGRLIPAAILAILVYGMIAAMLGTILPKLSDDFHLTAQQGGVIAFVQALGLIIASLSVGPLIDNRGKKTGLLLGLTLIAIALFLLPSSPSYGMVFSPCCSSGSAAASSSPQPMPW